MKKYKITAYYESGGHYFIEADTLEEAEKIAEGYIYDEKPFDKHLSGDRAITDSEEIKN